MYPNHDTFEYLYPALDTTVCAQSTIESAVKMYPNRDTFEYLYPALDTTVCAQSTMESAVSRRQKKQSASFQFIE